VARTTSLNATATASFTGRDAGLVMTTGTAYGSVKVFIDGVFAGTVDNHTGSGTKLREIVFHKGFTSAGTHTIQVVNQATSGHPRADLDGLIVLN
jgi:Beta-galactosidase jelly roll domain